MQLIIKDDKVIATHSDHIDLTPEQYPDCEIISFEGEVPAPIFDDGQMVLPDDPRTKAEKKEYYKDQRRLEYPPIEDQLDMIYWDKINETTEWEDTITAVKNKYPKK